MVSSSWARQGFICRGIVLDAAGYRGVGASCRYPRKPGEIGIVTADDVKAIIKKQGIEEPQPGDCVFLHTGHGNIWGNSVYKKMTSEQHAKARAEFGAGEPGFGISACEYMASRDIALMGGDTSSNDAQPSGEKGDALCRALPHRDADPARYLEPGKHGPEGAGRCEGLRVRVHLGAAQDRRRHGLAGKSDRDLRG